MLGEFGIVVVGVLAALAADSWLAEQDEIERSRSAVALLVADLETDSMRMAQVARFALPHDSVSATIFATPREADLPSDSVARLLLRLMSGGAFVATNSTYEALIQTDGVRHIGGSDLQFAIVRYYREQQAEVTSWHNQWSVRYDRFQELVGRHISPAPNSFEEGMEPWNTIPLRVTTSWDELRSDSELMTQIWAVGAYEEVLGRVIRDAQAANTNLRALLVAGSE